jgi:hypothetical protein
MAHSKKPNVDVFPYGPGQGAAALQFCWHDRPGIELQTKDGRVIARYHHKQLRPCNPEIWATYFDPPVHLAKR